MTQFLLRKLGETVELRLNISLSFAMEPFVLEDADGVTERKTVPLGVHGPQSAGLAVLVCHVTWHTRLPQIIQTHKPRQFYSQIPDHGSRRPTNFIPAQSDYPPDKMKFLKVGRVAIITRGRYAGKKVRRPRRCSLHLFFEFCAAIR